MSENVSGARRGAGGTEGGVGVFLIGVAMAAAGGYLLASRVMVGSNYWGIWGQNGFGLALIPLMAGIALLFFNGRNFFGWLLTIAGLAIIGAGVLMSMTIHFAQTPLFAVLMMLVLLMGGVGLIARAVRPWG